MALELHYAPQIYRALNGVFCLYKDSCLGHMQTNRILATKLARKLNCLEQRPQKQMVDIEGSLSEQNLRAVIKPNYADSTLIVGDRYSHEKDFKVRWAHYPGWFASGVMVGGIGPRGFTVVEQMKRAQYMRVYEVDVELGRATSDGFDRSRVVEKATFRHVRKEQFDRVLTKIQEYHKSLMYRAAGVSMSSQEGYELAVAGPVRPPRRGKEAPPIVYGLRCLRFDPPSITLRMQVINENPIFFADLVQRLGISLKTLACINKLRCTRFGMFHLDHALLHKHWVVDHILENIQLCKELTKRDKIVPPSLQLTSSENLIQLRELDERETESSIERDNVARKLLTA